MWRREYVPGEAWDTSGAIADLGHRRRARVFALCTECPRPPIDDILNGDDDGVRDIQENPQWLKPALHPEIVLATLRTTRNKVSSWNIKDNLEESLRFWYPHDWERRLQERLQAGRRPVGKKRCAPLKGQARCGVHVVAPKHLRTPRAELSLHSI